MKTLKELFEIYRPKAKGEQDFVDKHVVIKHKDRNGNGDDVFNGKTKVVNRKKERHGYDVGEDEKVYEEAEELDEMKNVPSHKLKAIVARGEKDEEGMSPAFGMQIKAARNELLRRKKLGIKEEVEDLDEEKEVHLTKRNKHDISHYRVLNNGKDVSRHDDYDEAKQYAAKHRAYLRKNGYKANEVTVHAYVKEDIDLDEAVSVSHHRYLRSHGKKASGSGAWIFTHKMNGKIDLNDDKSSHIGKGKFSDAAKSAKAWAKKHGHTTVYVAEEHADEMLRNAILEMAELEGEDLTEENLDTLVEALLDELSQKMVRAYRDKARDDKEDAEDQRDFYKAHDDNTSAEDKRIRKRSSGIKTASNKIYGFGKVNVKEEVEELDELSKGKLQKYDNAARNSINDLRWKSYGEPNYSDDGDNDRWDKTPEAEKAGKKLDSREKMLALAKAKKNKNGTTAPHYTPKATAKVRATNEEVEELDELSRKTLSNYVRKASPKVASHSASQMTTNDIANMEYHGNKVIKRLKGINTAASKLAKEEVEDLEELSKDTLKSYVKKSVSDLPKRGIAAQSKFDKGESDAALKQLHKIIKRQHGVDKAVDKMTKEEVEALDELSRKTLGSYVKKASPSASAALATAVSSSDKDNAISAGKRFSKRSIGIDRAINKLTKEDVINRAIEKYVVSEAELPTPADRLLSKLDGLSETHVNTLLTMFNGLNEDNQIKMLSTAETQEGVLSLLDFAIQNKGA